MVPCSGITHGHYRVPFAVAVGDVRLVRLAMIGEFSANDEFPIANRCSRMIRRY